MTRVLFVSNGHGESAIAERIARAVRDRVGDRYALDHLPLVGLGSGTRDLAPVGPRAAMPSGGLVAMGNLPAFARDLRAGFAGLFARQVAFVREARREYALAVAVGDVYALGMTLVSGLRTLFVGTAKSVRVAPYGPFERRVLARAARVFVRDGETAAALRAQGIAAEAPGNVIVDLLEEDASPSPPPGAWLGILPGSRERAYADAVALAAIVRALGRRHGPAEALLSVAPGLDAAAFAGALRADAWRLEPGPPAMPFEARAGNARLVAWSGGLGPLLRASRLVLGQAGTANEQAAAAGIPVVALDRSAAERSPTGGERWYRMRQRRLLGEALVLAPPEPAAAAEVVAGLLADGVRLDEMRRSGRERMGGGGGAVAIAGAIVAAAGEGPP